MSHDIDESTIPEPLSSLRDLLGNDEGRLLVREYLAMFDNLTLTQARCTELLNLVRRQQEEINMLRDMSERGRKFFDDLPRR